MNTAAIARANVRSVDRAIIRNTARTVVPPNLAAIERAGLTSAPMDDGSVLVAGKYRFFPTTGFWRSTCGSLQGYGTGTLLADIAIGEEIRSTASILPEIYEPPAVTEPLITDHLTDPVSDNQAEVAAGVTNSASKLPTVRP